MGSSSLFHLLAAYPLVQPPDVATQLASSGTPTAGVLTTHLLDPALPALGYSQLKLETNSSASGRPTYILGRWLTRPLSAQTIAAGNWQLYLALSSGSSNLYALAVGLAVAQWRPGAGVIARAVSAPIYPADVQTVATAGGPTGGTFTLTWAGSAQTAAINFNASAAALQTAVAAIPNIGGVTCTGGPLPAAISVTFTAPGPEPLLAWVGNALTGGTNPAVVIADVPPAAGTAGALAANSNNAGGVGSFVTLSTLAGTGLTLLGGDCLALEVWATGVLTNGAAGSADLASLANGTAQYSSGKYGTLTDTDAYLLAPQLISYP